MSQIKEWEKKKNKLVYKINIKHKNVRIFYDEWNL